MAKPLTLDDFSDPSPAGSTPRQHEFITDLIDWLDLSLGDAIDLAVELIPMSAMNGREIRGLGDLTSEEASELIDELKARKQEELKNRRSSVGGEGRRGGGRRW
jgi:hypothetical protein